METHRRGVVQTTGLKGLLRQSVMGKSADRRPARPAHVIVCGNEKGGTGKTTTAMHVAVHLQQLGQKVATVDLDIRQQSLTRYVENRRQWARSSGTALKVPTHYRFDTSELDSVTQAQAQDFSSLVSIFVDLENSHDFVVVDTPGSESHLMRMAHSMADTLLTPMNDSFVDFDVLGSVDSDTLEVLDLSHYATMVREARRNRRLADEGLLDWVIVRNRLASLTSRNEQKLMACVTELSMKLGFRLAYGIVERTIYREYFPMGLTALDDPAVIEAVSGRATSPSHQKARQEIERLVGALHLPLDAHSRKRAEMRRMWLETSKKPLKLPDIFAD